MLSNYMNKEAVNEFRQHYKESKWWLKKNAFLDEKLFTWENLGELISTHEFKGGDLVLAKSKLQFNPFVKHNKEIANKVNVSNIFSNYIKQGHTLILNSAHHWHPPLSKFCSILSQELKTNTQTNMYASWYNDEGAFGKHWDEHDVLIIQLDGRKHWKIFGVADENAVSHKHSKSSNDELLSEFVMEKGDILYIPMGQLHSVEMGNDISLHATVGIRRLTGLDVFEWLKEEVAKFPKFRERVPHLSDKDELQKFMSDFLLNLSDIHWSEIKNTTSFEEYIKSTITIRPYIKFPDIGSSVENKDLNNKKFVINSYITYLGEHQQGLKIGDGFKKWVVPSGVSSSFKQLLNGELVDFDAILVDGQINGIDKSMVEKICGDMLDEGVVTFC